MSRNYSEPHFNDPADRDYAWEIRTAIDVLSNTAPYDGEDMASAIHQAGVNDWRLACMLSALVPICCAREMLHQTGMFLPPEFIIWDQDRNDQIRRWFRDDPICCRIVEQLPMIMENNFQERLDNLLDRSPELDLVRQFKEEGSNLNDLMLGPPIVIVRPPPGQRTNRRRRPSRSHRRTPGWLIALIVVSISLPVLLCAGILSMRYLLLRLPAKTTPGTAPNGMGRIQRPKGPERLYRKGQPVQQGMIAQLPYGNRLMDVLILRVVDEEKVEIGWIGWTANWNEIVPISKLHEKPGKGKGE